MAVVVGITVGVVVVGKKNDDASTETGDNLAIEAEIAQVIGHEQVQEPAYARALKWITVHDPMQLTTASPNLLQRFIGTGLL